MEIKIGIYKIISPSGKIYIGQSINIEKRWNRHITALNKKSKLYLSLYKYGHENHIFEIIEECSIDLLLKKEVYWKKYYLEQFSNDWNKVLFHELYDRGSGGPMSDDIKNKISNSNKGKIYSEETKLKMSLKKIGIPKSEEYKKKVGDAHRGKILSDEVKSKISKSKTGLKLSDEVKLNMSLNRKPKSQIPILQYSTNGDFIKEWDGATKVSMVLGYNPSSITACCKLKLDTANNFLWRYKTENYPLILDVFKINQYSKDNIIINKFVSSKEASNITGISQPSICNNLKGTSKTAGGYIWKKGKN